jgi:hypothetical protein
MFTNIARTATIGIALATGSASSAVEKPESPSTEVTKTDTTWDKPKLYKQLGALEATIEGIDLHFKNNPNADNSAWRDRKSALSSLIEVTEKKITPNISAEDLKQLGEPLLINTGILQLYAGSLSSKNSQVSGTLGTFDAGSFEGMKLGAKVLSNLLTQNDSKKPEDLTNKLLRTGLDSLANAENPQQLSQQLEPMIMLLLSKLPKQPVIGLENKANANTKIINSDPALIWKLEWQKIVDLDKTPRLHPAGKAGYEARCFEQLASNPNGLKVIKDSAKELLLKSKTPLSDNAKKLKEIVVAESAEKIKLMQNPSALNVLKEATTQYLAH